METFTSYDFWSLVGAILIGIGFWRVILKPLIFGGDDDG